MDIDATAMLTLQAFEESMWREETRFDAAYMEALLSRDFTEVGQSGRAYSREDTISLRAVDIDIALPLLDFRVTRVADDVALVRYTSVPARSRRGAAHRASIWVHEESWKLRYHQATPTSL